MDTSKLTPPVSAVSSDTLKLSKKDRRVRSEKDKTDRRALVFRIRLDGVMDLDEMAAELARLSAWPVPNLGPNVRPGSQGRPRWRGAPDPGGTVPAPSAGAVRGHAEKDPDPAGEGRAGWRILQEAGRLTLRILARIDKVSGAETHVKRVQLGGEVAIGRPVSEAEHAAALAAIRGGVES